MSSGGRTALAHGRAAAVLARLPARRPPAARGRWTATSSRTAACRLSEYEILAQLSESPNRQLRMSELADRVVQSRSRLTHTAIRLEKRGWVVREPCPDDRRGVLLRAHRRGLGARSRQLARGARRQRAAPPASTR